MRVLFIDQGGFAVDLVVRAMLCGHECKHFIRQTPKTLNIGRGLTDVIEDFQPWVNWADLIFLSDNTRYLQDVDRMRAAGKLVVGADSIAASWELDRGVGQAILSRVGIPTMPSHTFHDYDSAIKWVCRRPGRWVSKPCGSDDKSLSYVSKNADDMLYMLERWKELGKNLGPFILQEFVDGTEMAVGGWFGPKGFAPGWCENWEFKKLMDGDLGVATGEQGTVLRYVRRSQLADRVLKPLEGQLRRLQYCGYIDVNCIIDEDGTPWPLEFTMRPGWPTIQIQQCLHDADFMTWLHALASGGKLSTPTLSEIAVGIVLSIPDYPYSHLTRKTVTGVPIYGVTPGLDEHLHGCEVMSALAPRLRGTTIEREWTLCTAGDYVLVMTATGPDVLSTKRTAMRRLKRLIVPNSPMWRTDIGDRLSKQLPTLQSLGYATAMTFNSARP